MKASLHRAVRTASARPHVHKPSDPLWTYERMLRQAMSLQDAYQVLGLDPNSTPSKDEIARAYKQKARENHPDLGGDPAKMVEVNVAKDILEGKQRPGRPSTGPASQPTPGPYRPPERKHEGDSWEVAWRKAHVPSEATEADWFMKVPVTGRTSYGDNHYSASVYVGRTDKWFYFLGVSYEHSFLSNFLGSRGIVEIENYELYCTRRPTTDPAGWAERDERVILDGIKDVLQSKKLPHAKSSGAIGGVYWEPGLSGKILATKPPTLTQFRTKIKIKDALNTLLGKAPGASPKEKLNVELELGPELKDERGHGKFGVHQLTLIINGRRYLLSEKSSDIIGYKGLRKVFGEYFYPGSAKNLTKMKAAKEILTIFAQLDVDPALKELLERAAAQKG